MNEGGRVRRVKRPSSMKWWSSCSGRGCAFNWNTPSIHSSGIEGMNREGCKTEQDTDTTTEAEGWTHWMSIEQKRACFEKTWPPPPLGAIVGRPEQVVVCLMVHDQPHWLGWWWWTCVSSPLGRLYKTADHSDWLSSVCLTEIDGSSVLYNVVQFQVKYQWTTLVRL